MAWIKSCQELLNHPKTSELAFLLDEEIYSTIGRLHMLWWWALDYAKDGDLSNIKSRIIAQKVGWSGDPEQLINALVESGFLDRTDDGLFIHDWDDYTGGFTEKREKERARKERYRRSRASVDEPVDDPQVTRDKDGTSTGQGWDNDGTKWDCPADVPRLDIDIDIDKDKDKDKDLPTERAERAADVVSGDISISEVPRAMRHTAKYLLSETGRRSITASELTALRLLNEHHLPSRVMTEIDMLVRRFREKQRDPTMLTFAYVWQVMERMRPTRKAREKQRDEETEKIGVFSGTLGRLLTPEEIEESDRLIHELEVANCLEELR